MEKLSSIRKLDVERRLVYGVVLEPDSTDSQGDVLDSETIEKAAHDYMRHSQTIGDQHDDAADAKVVESFIAPVDYEAAGETIKKGSWVMVVKVMDDELWALCKAGEYTGFSIGGVGERTEIDG